MAEQKLLFSSLHDLTDTSYRYGVYGPVITGEKFIKTSGASTTVSENTSGDAVFAGFAVGDLIHVKTDGAWATRAVTAVGSIPTSVTVSSNITLTGGKAWSFQKWNSGTSASDGWFRVAEFNDWTVEFEWVTDNAASVEWIIEGRINGGAAAELESGSFSGVGTTTQPGYDYVDEIRVGMKITSDGGANNVRASFIGERFV